MAQSDSQTDKNKPPEKSVRQDASKTSPTPPARGNRSPAGWRNFWSSGASAVGLLIALITVAGVVYLGYRVEFQTDPAIALQQNRVTTLEDAFESIQSHDSEQINEQVAALQALRTRLDQQAVDIDALSTQLAQSITEQSGKIAELVEKSSSISENLNQRADDWELNDVALLLLIGAKQLELTRNPAAVLPVWQLVSTQISQQSDPQLLVVRAQLNKEIELLQSMKPADVAGISRQLLELIATLEELPLRVKMSQPLSDAGQITAQSPEGSALSTVQATIDAVWRDLKSLVQVKKVTETSSLPLNPHLRDAFLERLKLSLASAQIAALRGETEAYQANLAFMIDSVNQYFDIEDLVVIEYLSALTTLSQMPVNATLPDMAQSHALLQEVIRHQPVD